MSSNQERFDLWLPLATEFNRLAHLAGTDPELLGEVANRTSLISSGFMLMRPSIDAVGGLAFTSIHQSRPEIASAQTFKIYLRFEEDAGIHPQMQRIVKMSEAGCYDPFVHMVMVNMESPETLTHRASVLLHEFGHAFAAAKAGRAMTQRLESAEVRIAEEMELRTFDYRLMLMLGGPEYRSLAHDFALEIMNYRTGQQKKPPEARGRGIALDHCWGPVADPQQKKFRDGEFRLYCELMATDLYAHPSIRHSEKCRQVSPVSGANHTF